MDELIAIFICCIFALIAHGSYRSKVFEWIIRITIGVCAFGCAVTAVSIGSEKESAYTAWQQAMLITATALSFVVLFKPFREAVSYVLTAVNQILGGRVFVALKQKKSALEALLAERIFVKESIPHMYSLWVYICVFCYMLAGIRAQDFGIPTFPLPIPVTPDQLLVYNGIALIVLAACGIGIMVTRNPQQALARLGLESPKGWQVGVALLAVIGTFAYDYLWSLYTHSLQGGMEGKLTNYNLGAFDTGGGAAPSALLALSTALCAGVGEEVLMRGAIQPALGIFPAAIMHGILHAQFQHAPILILQVAGWSILMGILRRYTNTTTTLICHVTFNFLMTFLFAFNPK